MPIFGKTKFCHIESFDSTANPVISKANSPSELQEAWLNLAKITLDRSPSLHKQTRIKHHNGHKRLQI